MDRPPCAWPSVPAFTALVQEGESTGTVAEPLAEPLTVLLLPGLGGNSLIFSAQFMDAVASATGAALVLGLTYGFPFGPTLEVAAAQTWAALRGLPLVSAQVQARVARVCRVLLIGYSMGGFVAQVMAASVPADVCLSGLVLLSSAVPTPAGLPVPGAELWQAVAARPPVTVMQRMQGLFPAPWLRASTAPTLHALATTLDAAHVSKTARGQELAALMHFLFTDGVYRLRGILGARVPLLALHGTEDRVLDVSSLQRTLRPWTEQDQSQGQVTVCTFEGAGHGLFLQNSADVVAALQKWWRGLAPIPAAVCKTAPEGITGDASPVVLPAVFVL